MALTLPADAGEPMPADLVADAEVRDHKFRTGTREVLLRNTGANTLWISLDDGETFFDVACGTSWDGRVTIDKLWYCTQVGTTEFTVLGLALIGGD
jgi:hypothetical protein